jgi:hypothetical protein
VRRSLILLSIICMIVFMLATTLLTFRYVNSGAGLLQLATLANIFGRPLVALIFSAVLVVRFRHIWSRRVDINEPLTSGVAKVAQVTGLILLGVFYCVLAVVLYLRFGISAGLQAEVPNLFIFGPLLMSLPFGYFLFEFGWLIDRGRRDADA